MICQQPENVVLDAEIEGSNFERALLFCGGGPGFP
jgi:hypothetical protein